MYKSSLNSMENGWFIGDFTPSVLRTKDFEVAIKKYKKGSLEKEHYHKIATEITVIISGKVRMFDQYFLENDIIVVMPGDSTSFEALEDTVTLVVKQPSSTNDKYVVEAKND